MIYRGGFDRQRPAVWLVEGLLYYLTDTQVHHVLGTLMPVPDRDDPRPPRGYLIVAQR